MRCSVGFTGILIVLLNPYPIDDDNRSTDLLATNLVIEGCELSKSSLSITASYSRKTHMIPLIKELWLANALLVRYTHDSIY